MTLGEITYHEYSQLEYRNQQILDLFAQNKVVTIDFLVKHFESDYDDTEMEAALLTLFGLGFLLQNGETYSLDPGLQRVLTVAQRFRPRN